MIWTGPPGRRLPLTVTSTLIGSGPGERSVKRCQEGASVHDAGGSVDTAARRGSSATDSWSPSPEDHAHDAPGRPHAPFYFQLPDDFDVHAQCLVHRPRSCIPGKERLAMLPCGCADERIVDGTSGDPQLGELTTESG